ncbi:glycosyltransferase family 2 protein [Tumebacillus flagellatus]|nr:glycosyltransferase [Tumebacillus flagellatus]
MRMHRVSIIIPVKNEGEHVRETLRSLQQAQTGWDYEVILVDDASTDGCLDFLAEQPSDLRLDSVQVVRTAGVGAAAARNAGAERAGGEFLVFCDAHLFFEDQWLDKLLEPILADVADAVTPGIAPHDAPDAVGYGQTLDPETFQIKWNGKQAVPFPTALLSGACFAIPRRVFEEIGGFERGFREWGYEDVEISIKLWLFGYSCCAQPDVKILHVFRKKFPYLVNADSVDYNLLRMACSHFSEERIAACRQFLSRPERARYLLASLFENGVLQQRQRYFVRRKHADSWFFDVFEIDF